jgi:NADPH-dependent 2,4-dienoyl-CoA reductase/sulfur reductase-like enzyme
VEIVGAGFAGFNAARELARLAGGTTEIVVINSTDYFLYLPLMPQVAGGLAEPGHSRVSPISRMRVLTDWILNATTPSETTSFSVISAESVPLDVNNPRT